MSKIKSSPKPVDKSITGTYRYDRATGQVVRVSDRVPKVASKGAGAASDCGESSCDSGGPGPGGCCGGGACGN